MTRNTKLTLAAVTAIGIIAGIYYSMQRHVKSEDGLVLDTEYDLDFEETLIDDDLAISEQEEEIFIAPEIPTEEELMKQMISDLSPKEMVAFKLQVLQVSVSKRIDNLSPGSLSEEELQKLFEDIDYLEENAVFLGKEAEQLKIYAKTTLGY